MPANPGRIIILLCALAVTRLSAQQITLTTSADAESNAAHSFVVVPAAKNIPHGIKHNAPGAHFLVVGERGVNYMREYGFAYTPFSGISPDETRFDLAAKVQREIFRMALKDEYGQVILVFPHAASISTQKIQVLN